MKRLSRFGAPALYLSTLLYMGYVDVRNWGAYYYDWLADRRGNYNKHASLSERLQLARDLKQDEGRTVLVEFINVKTAIGRKWAYTRKGLELERITAVGSRHEPSVEPFFLNPDEILNEEGRSVLYDTKYDVRFIEVNCRPLPLPLEKCIRSVHNNYEVSPFYYKFTEKGITRIPNVEKYFFVFHLITPGIQ